MPTYRVALARDETFYRESLARVLVDAASETEARHVAEKCVNDGVPIEWRATGVERVLAEHAEVREVELIE